MDKDSQKITAKIDKDLINHFLFDYVERRAQIDLQSRIDCGASIIVGFYNNEELKFIAAFDFEKDCLHVRHVIGSFGKLHDTLDKFAQGLAKFLNNHYISFTTEKRAVAKWANEQGYIPVESKNEFVKVLH